MREYVGKHILAYIRQDNYAHPGEEDAILRVMNKFDKNPYQNILDIGCGLGGTASFIQKNGWGRIFGFDIETSSIDYAKKTYPNVDYRTSDVNYIHNVFQNKFDILCAFTSFYAFHNQESALLSLNKTTKLGGYLAIFDYLDLCANEVNPLFRDDTHSAPFIPLKIDNIEAMLNKAGWQLESLVDISNEFLIWYEQLLSKITARKTELEETFGEAAYQKTYNTYKQMLDVIFAKKLGGMIVYAKKIMHLI